MFPFFNQDLQQLTFCTALTPIFIHVANTGTVNFILTYRLLKNLQKVATIFLVILMLLVRISAGVLAAELFRGTKLGQNPKTIFPSNFCHNIESAEGYT